MKTYTAHKLTDAQLRRLSTIVNGSKGARYGMAALALERKGLITPHHWTHDGVERQWIQSAATAAGVEALAAARREGW